MMYYKNVIAGQEADQKFLEKLFHWCEANCPSEEYHFLD